MSAESTARTESLREAVSAHTRVGHELPLIHTTRCEHLPGIIRSGAIDPRPCKNFGEDLSYFSYGRPSFRSRLGSFPGDPKELCPVCFVFKPYIPMRGIARVFPCDSGALLDQRFSPFLTAADSEQLQIEPSLDAAGRLAHLFYPDNAHYYQGRVRKFVEPCLDGVGQRYHDLLRSSERARFDDRRSAVEVQVRESVALRNRLLYVILPEEFLCEPDIRRAIYEDWNCEPMVYPTFEGEAPAAYYPIIRDRLFTAMQASRRL